MTRYRHRRCIGLVLLVAALGSSTSHARSERPEQADLTKDGNALKYAKEEGVLLRTYNLGPTGMRGWIYDSWSAEDQATQILVTQVETNSPADGRMEVADVILGVDGERFTKNARKTFALAIGTAESEQQKGRIPLLVWRNGKELAVTAAQELAERKEDVLPRVMQLAEGQDPNTMIGVCHVLAHLKERSLPAMPLLIRWLEHEDPWVRVQAAEALKTLGETARPAVPAMLKAVAATDASDPLRFGQGSLCYALFYPGGNVAGSPGLLAKSIEGVDRDLLYPAIRAVSVHPDGHARGCLRSTYSLLTLEDVKALLPEIVASADVDTMAPCNTMFSKGVMLAAIGK